MGCRRRRPSNFMTKHDAAIEFHDETWRNFNQFFYIFFSRFKLENRDSEIVSACCLRSKLYSILYGDKMELVKMKGQPHSSFARNNINFTTFTELLKGKTNKPSKYYKIGSKNHKVTKFLQRKRNLVSAFDDKRWLYSCKIHSLPYGSRHAKKENSKKCLFCPGKVKNV